MPRSWPLRVDDILMAIDNLEHIVLDRSFGEFAQDPVAVQAAAFNFIVIGEAAAAITRDLRDRHPEIPWRKMRHMRNLIAHEYFTVDERVLWATICKSLPPLRDQLRALLVAEGAEE